MLCGGSHLFRVLLALLFCRGFVQAATWTASSDLVLCSDSSPLGQLNLTQIDEAPTNVTVAWAGMPATASAFLITPFPVLCTDLGATLFNPSQADINTGHLPLAGRHVYQVAAATPTSQPLCQDMTAQDNLIITVIGLRKYQLLSMELSLRSGLAQLHSVNDTAIRISRRVEVYSANLGQYLVNITYGVVDEMASPLTARNRTILFSELQAQFENTTCTNPDPCLCSTDGTSGGVATGEIGCFTFQNDSVCITTGGPQRLALGAAMWRDTLQPEALPFASINYQIQVQRETGEFDMSRAQDDAIDWGMGYIVMVAVSAVAVQTGTQTLSWQLANYSADITSLDSNSDSTQTDCENAAALFAGAQRTDLESACADILTGYAAAVSLLDVSSLPNVDALVTDLGDAAAQDLATAANEGEARFAEIPEIADNRTVDAIDSIERELDTIQADLTEQIDDLIRQSDDAIYNELDVNGTKDMVRDTLDPEDEQTTLGMATVVDNPANWDLKYPLAEALLGNGQLELTVAGVLNSCRNNTAIWTALLLDESDGSTVPNITELTALDTKVDFEAQLGAIRLDDVDIVTNDTLNELRDILGLDLQERNLTGFGVGVATFDADFDELADTLIDKAAVLDDILDLVTTYADLLTTVITTEIGPCSVSTYFRRYGYKPVLQKNRKRRSKRAKSAKAAEREEKEIALAQELTLKRQSKFETRARRGGMRAAGVEAHELEEQRAQPVEALSDATESIFLDDFDQDDHRMGSNWKRDEQPPPYPGRASRSPRAYRESGRF
ncbi:uncharacterized protein MONBRDRAFT_7900 [Monosiga brevicollis MX1]|uniref:Uncharacterized protein n=1 Tax=Monosiga brevicollis TaxID=81824 RepID=A9UYE9_MONBE|nr:uncharacterized protein MONBRDRAFT_7900 [Monosiga brevicollis MX1]EDQ89593.1 predicted protein [Monosiga brevicollis MX1]|eukprot:XP_001745622.1 hypothetical protein [Monosiga brevicollis MX1]